MRFLSVFITLLFFGCQSTSKELPILSYKINDDGTKSNYTITYENFTNQSNEPFSTESIKHKVFIANFFFTRCPSICPPMRTKLIEIAETFGNDEDFMVVSHTIDPENDSVEVLGNYSETTGISVKKWQLVRSTLENTRLQADQFMTNFKPNEAGTDFYHSSYVALVDKKQQIRGFYNVLAMDDVARLENDIRSLLK